MISNKDDALSEQLASYKTALEQNSTVDDAINYAKDVVSGKVVAGKLLTRSCFRFLSDLKYGDLRGIKFSRNKASHALSFFPLFCVHIKGDLAGKPIILEPWQAFIIVQLFGFYRKNAKGVWVRRFRYVYIEVARKNGKSTLVSGIALYMLAFDGEGGAEVWCAAVDKEQAKIVWEASAAMIEESPALSELLTVTRSKNLVELPTNYSKFGPLSRDTKKMDGLNVHCGILDEVHAHPTRDIFDLVKDGMSSRLQPILAMITTAGVNKHGICYEQRKYASEILSDESEVEDDNYLAVIYSIDDDDDPHDERAWPKANPCLGVSKQLDGLQANSKIARVSAVALINFLIKDCNRWVDGGIRWIDSKKWLSCAADTPPNLQDYLCWLGVDLSIKGDVTALVKLFQIEDGWFVLPEFYYPYDSLDELPPETKALFLQWQKDGYLNIMPGAMIDLDKIEERIVCLNSELGIAEVCVDPWKAHQLNYRLNNQDIEAIDVGQTIKNFSETMQTIDGYIDEKTITHDGNPMMAWMMSNIEVTVDKNDNIFPYKANQNRDNKIDGGTALFTAAFRAFIGGGQETNNPNIRML